MSNWRVREAAVPQVENMPWTAVRLVENAFGLPADFRDLGKEDGRIKVSLDGHIPQAPPGGIQVDTPIHPDHLPPGFLHEFQEHRGLRPKVDDGNPRTNALDDLSAVGKDVFAVILG